MKMVNNLIINKLYNHKMVLYTGNGQQVVCSSKRIIYNTSECYYLLLSLAH